MGRFVILSGPSCVGKGPLHAALKKSHPELAQRLKKLVLYNSRAPRPGELDGVDYHFRQRGEIEELRDRKDFAVMDVRGDLQAVDLKEAGRTFASGDAFFEGNPFVGGALLELPVPPEVEMLTVFLSPLSREEIAYLQEPARGVCLPDFITDVMRRKLLRRTRRQKADLSLKDLENIEKRASSAYREMKEAWRFQYVIPNHDGEDSENWDAFYHPVGDARKTLLAFAGLLEGRVPAAVEKWEEGTLA